MGARRAGRSWLLFAALWCGTGFVIKRGAVAADDDVVHVAVPPCPQQSVAADREELLAIAASELAPRRIELVAAPRADALQIELCDEQMVRFAWLRRGSPASRELSLAGLAREARARTLALALAELATELAARHEESGTSVVRRSATTSGEMGTSSSAQPGASSSRERVPSPSRERAPSPSRERSPSSSHERSPSTSREREPSSRGRAERSSSRGRPLRGILSAETRAFAAPWTLTYGPKFTLDVSRIRLGAAVLMGSGKSPLGAARVGLALGSLGYELWRVRELFALVAAGEIGAAWAQGKADQGVRPGSSTVVALAGLLAAALRLPLGRALSSELTLSGGFSYGLTARAGTRQVASTYGPCVALGLGLGWE